MCGVLYNVPLANVILDAEEEISSQTVELPIYVLVASCFDYFQTGRFARLR